MANDREGSGSTDQRGKEVTDNLKKEKRRNWSSPTEQHAVTENTLGLMVTPQHIQVENLGVSQSAL